METSDGFSEGIEEWYDEEETQKKIKDEKEKRNELIEHIYNSIGLKGDSTKSFIRGCLELIEMFDRSGDFYHRNRKYVPPLRVLSELGSDIERELEKCHPNPVARSISFRDMFKELSIKSIVSYLVQHGKFEWSEYEPNPSDPNDDSWLQDVLQEDEK